MLLPARSWETYGVKKEAQPSRQTPGTEERETVHNKILVENSYPTVTSELTHPGVC